MFVYKNKNWFGLHESGGITRTAGTILAILPHWDKSHSRMQAAYQGSELFNELPVER